MKTMKTILGCLALLMLIMLMPTQASAAKKIRLSGTNIITYDWLENGAELKIFGNFKKRNLYPTNKIKWTCSNKKVVTIKEIKGAIKNVRTGERFQCLMILPKKTGRCTITVKVGKKKLKCKVTVVHAPKRTAYTGSTEKVPIAEEYGKPKFKWTSSNKNIATVSKKGVVKFKKTGKVTITAKAKGIKGTRRYTVKEPYLWLNQNKKIDNHSETLSWEKKGETEDLGLVGATITKCQSSNPKVAKVTKSPYYKDHCKVEAVSCGTATITITGSNKKVYTVKVVLQHNELDNWIVDKEPTCTESGSKYKICEYCGTKLTEYISPIGYHSFDEGKVINGPTCTKGTETVQICRICGAEYHTYGNDALGHQESDWIIDVEPTCYQNGERHKECIRCSLPLAREWNIPRTGHLASDWIIDVEPTYDKEGEQHKECIFCKMVLEKMILKPTNN